MSETIQFHSRVGDDGVLNFQVNLGSAEAEKEVVVTIESIPDVNPTDPLDWPDFVEQTYGSCAGSGLERHDQGAFESREPIV